MIIPAPGYILIEPLENDTKTSSGLLLAENAKDKPIKGRVLAIGRFGPKTEGVGVPIVNLNEYMIIDLRDLVRVGDKVIFRKWGGQDVTEDNKEYKLVKFDEILGVIE